MQRLHFVFLAAIIVMPLPRLGVAEPHDGGRPLYDVQTGILTYDLSRQGLTDIRRTVYFDASGSRELTTDWCEDCTGTGSHTLHTTLVDGVTMYEIDAASGHVTRSTIGVRERSDVDIQSLKEATDQSAALADLAARGITIAQAQDIAGFACDMIAREQGPITTTVWIHKGIVLKRVVTLNRTGSVVESLRAVRVQLDAPVDPNVFRLPEQAQPPAAGTTPEH